MGVSYRPFVAKRGQGGRRSMCAIISVVTTCNHAIYNDTPVFIYM